MKSKLLKGVLWHKRHRPVVNEFRKKVLYLDLDCDELDSLQNQLRLLSRNKFNAYAVNDKDHFSHDNMGLTKSMYWHMRSKGKTPNNLRLITQPSAYGYVFNPVSFYIGLDEDQRDTTVVAEVHNRIGQRHLYDLHSIVSDGTERARFDKKFYVSPFLSMDCWYEFSIVDEEKFIKLNFDEYDSNGLLFQASLELKAFPLNDRNLAASLFTHPIIPWRTVAAIYLQALKLKLKGLPYLEPQQEERDNDHVAR